MCALTTPRLVLEPLGVAHADAMFDVLADPALYAFLDHPPPRSTDELRETYGRLETRRSPDGSQRWLNWIVADARGTAMGFVQATVMPDRSAWIAYLLARRHQGHGYATEATRAIVDHLRVDHRVARVRAMVEVDNVPSIALLARVGFRAADEEESSRHRPAPSERLYVRDFDLG